MHDSHIWAGPGPSARRRPLPRAADDAAPAPARATILVIEDDPIVSLAMENLLSEAGYLVLASVPRGEDAVAMSERHRPDLVLADVKLAGPIDGIEAVAAILAKRKVPIIFVTAHTDSRTTARMRLLEPAEMLSKPVPDALLLHAVARVLRG